MIARHDQPPGPHLTTKLLFDRTFNPKRLLPPNRLQHAVLFTPLVLPPQLPCEPLVSPPPPQPNLLPPLSVPGMANSGHAFSVSHFLVGLCLVTLVFESEVFVLADDDDAGYVGGNGIKGGSGAGDTEICSNDLSSFLPPPYSNISNVVCKPIWNTFVLRVSQSDLDSGSVFSVGLCVFFLSFFLPT